MSLIKSRKHPVHRITPSLAPGLLATALLGSVALVSHAHATDAPDLPLSTEAQIAQAKNLPRVQVNGHAGPDYRIDHRASPKFTQLLLDTTQTVSVISRDLIQQQGATTLTEALRNSPGVGTFYAGENGTTGTGDAIYMRGFDSSGSIFVDGVRDLGTISRDVFNIEQIEVTKGPDGTEYGRTAPTGAINLVSKQPLPGNRVSGSVSHGGADQKRSSADWNQTIDNNAVFRLNVMGQNSGVPGRDDVENNAGAWHRVWRSGRAHRPACTWTCCTSSRTTSRRWRLDHRPARLRQPGSVTSVSCRRSEGRSGPFLRHQPGSRPRSAGHVHRDHPA